MAKTLGEQLDETQTAISAALKAQEYNTSNGNGLKRTPFSLLQKREEDLIRLIAKHGRDYIPGQNTTPTRRGIRIKKAVWK